MPKYKNLLPSERQRIIFEIVLQSNTITINELAEQFEVSAMTIRRDLAVLEKEGKVVAVHGGVVSQSMTPFELSFAQREILHTGEKRKIGFAAAQLVNNHEVIALDGSTTALHVARSLRGFQDLKVITNGIKVATELAHRSGITVVMTGGEVYLTNSLVGPVARATIDRLRVNRLFLSVTGISDDLELYVPSEADAEIKEALLRMADQAVLIADSSKFGKLSYAKVQSISDVDILVSDENIPDAAVRMLEERGIQVIVARMHETQPEPRTE